MRDLILQLSKSSIYSTKPVIAGEKVTINPLQMVVILIIQPHVINGNGAEE
ncbi:hypothetical protein [Klebsiella pneumoniae]|uniref:hypothetical protein n=1 Tax=Klebsiella pneumoniae TaxID=573 RepID=UPI0024060EE2|nr:hypothetical protein [Klebsiella pneumoniae]MDG0616426.1 hypothetical protein [Klebsiella pneumoniae]